MSTATGMYSPEQIFEAFLYEQVQRKKTQENINTREVHEAFYKAQKELEFQDLMSGYKFLLKTEPHSPTLDRMFWEFRQSGILTVDNKIKNPEPLKESPEELIPVARYICDKI